MDRRLHNKLRDKIKDRKNNFRPHDFTTGCPQRSIISTTIFNRLVALLLTVNLPPSVDILTYADDLVLILHGIILPHKLQKALNAVDKAANSSGIYFSPAKSTTMALSISKQSQHKYKLGLQDLEMVNN